MSLNLGEKKILLALKDGSMSLSDLEKATNLKKDAILKYLEWLKEKGLVKVEEIQEEVLALNDEGKRYLEEGLPERRVLDLVLQGTNEVRTLEQRIGNELKIGIVWLSKLGLARVENGRLVLKEKPQVGGQKLETEELLEILASGVKKDDLPEKYKKLVKARSRIIEEKKRKHITASLTDAGLARIKEGLDLAEEESYLTPSMLKTGSWRKKRFRAYDVMAPTPPVYPGKRHFARQAMDYVRRIWLDMGFREMEGPLLESSFWNFDVLFVPQDHPAREMQDTFYLPYKATLPDSKIVSRVKEAHEKGVCGSLGWGYPWNEEEARRMVLRTHTTVLSARTLARLKASEIPSKFFAVGTVFRNEALDWKHLFEFVQSEGIVVGEDVNFRHLLGYLKEFLGKLGFKQVRFRPAYFPYTEMSVEPEVYHPIRKEWMELGGAGIFRPEVVEPLLGKDLPVLAWGLGVERLIIDYYGINDLRDIYKNDVQELRDRKAWMPWLAKERPNTNSAEGE